MCCTDGRLWWRQDEVVDSESLEEGSWSLICSSGASSKVTRLPKYASMPSSPSMTSLMTLTKCPADWLAFKQARLRGKRRERDGVRVRGIPVFDVRIGEVEQREGVAFVELGQDFVDPRGWQLIEPTVLSRWQLMVMSRPPDFWHHSKGATVWRS